jgi:hypothetical protein
MVALMEFHVWRSDGLGTGQDSENFEEVRMSFSRALRTFLFLALAALSAPLFAQQTGSVSGKVTATDGSLLPRRDR